MLASVAKSLCRYTIGNPARMLLLIFIKRAILLMVTDDIRVTKAIAKWRLY